MTHHAAAIASENSAVSHGSFVVERIYPVSPSKVFAAFRDPVSKRRWFIEGEGWDVFEYTAEFRVGGREFSRFAFRGGPEMYNETIYHDIVPDERMIFSYGMGIGDRPFSASLATIELATANGGTRLTYTEQGAYLGGADDIAGREEGCRDLFEKLALELANQ